MVIRKKAAPKPKGRAKEVKTKSAKVVVPKGAPRPFTITGLLEKGVEQNVLDHARRSIATMGTLRGGSAGAIMGDGTQFGCVRKAALRYHGYDLPIDDRTQILMQFGLSNEDVLDKFVGLSGWPKDRIKREEEIPVDYALGEPKPEDLEADSRERVTGRPDLVLLDENGAPFWGVEMKLKGTVYGAKNILLSSKVDTAHIIQSLHYMWKHGLSRYSIVYSIPVRFAVQGADAEAFKAVGCAELKPDGTPNYAKLGFYETIFEWDAEADSLSCYTVHSGVERREIPLRIEHISSFYSLVAQVAHRETLGGRPTKKSILPNQWEWDLCQMCPLAEVCDSYESDIDTWWDFAVEKISSEWKRLWPNLHEAFLNDFKE